MSNTKHGPFSVEVLPAWEELPKDVADAIDLDCYGSDTTFFVLVIRSYGAIVTCETDKSEPEDASFGRDLAWIKPALDDAFNRGVEASVMDSMRALYERFGPQLHGVRLDGTCGNLADDGQCVGCKIMGVLADV